MSSGSMPAMMIGKSVRSTTKIGIGGTIQTSGISSSDVESGSVAPMNISKHSTGCGVAATTGCVMSRISTGSISATVLTKSVPSTSIIVIGGIRTTQKSGVVSSKEQA
jgi:hypothetical protein